jgi:hypothetical protein
MFLRAQSGHRVGNDLPSRPPDNVSDQQQSHEEVFLC